ncbi:MAG TPA: adenylate/guanylate cyclase domain-containing protein [Reyranella sp.]|nr:adenylate/guanylate cyclase domain-containing protein [Reyranella sp.]
MIDGAPGCDGGQQLVAQLCERLVAAGLPLARLRLSLQMLHPDVAGVTTQWRPDESLQINVASFVSELERHSAARPTNAILSDAAQPRADEMMDDVVLPLTFTNGSVHSSAWATTRPDGFTEPELAALRRLASPLARVIEIMALRRTAATLLDTYVGNRAGARILAGQIQRGHTEVMNAAIWLSDMRNFTPLSDSLPAETIVDILNRYFDCQVPVIHAHGGEVLKFMGDGLLAIFPIGDSEADAAAACARALNTARECRAAVHALTYRHDGGTIDEFRFGVALHVGQVLYGNIGGSSRFRSDETSADRNERDAQAWGGSRLDFTCIGPAVNLAARLEKIAAQLGRNVVASSEFARHIDLDWVALGSFAVRGFALPEEIFGLPDD